MTTHYSIILDKSGSMQDCINSTIKSFNEQLDSIKNLKKEFSDQEFSISLTTFNDNVDIHYTLKDPDTINNLTKNEYITSGLTSLYDAIGITVERIRNQINISDECTNVIFVIITDGHENSSNKYNFYEISTLIKELESTGLYTFNYLGATYDAVEVASKLNIKKDNAMYFSKLQYEETTEVLTQSYKDMATKKSKGDFDYQLFLKKKM